MAADDSFSWLGHLQYARPGDLRALEAVVNGKAKNEWETVCETAFHLRQRPNQLVDNSPRGISLHLCNKTMAVSASAWRREARDWCLNRPEYRRRTTRSPG